MNMEEIIERAQRGECRNEQEHDMIVFRESERLAKKHGIVWNGEEVLPEEKMADSLFIAAAEFLVLVGVLYVDENRVISITDGDVEEALRVRHNVKIGRGNEEVELKKRKPGDGRRPLYVGGPIGGAVSEEVFKDLHESIAREDVCGLYTGALETYNGVQCAAKSPMALLAVWREVEWAREACVRAGKPGLALFGPSTSSRAEHFLSVANSMGLGPGDVSEVYMLDELKVDREAIVKLVHHRKLGNHVITGQCPMLGAYTGSAEGLAIVEAAEALGAYVIVSPTIHGTGPVHINYHASSLPEVLWASNLVCLALSRNSDILTGRYYWNLSGMGTTMNLLETSAQVLGDIYCGREMIMGPVGRGGNRPDMASGMDAQLVNGVLDLFCGKPSDAVAEAIERTVSQYREEVKNAPEGVPFGKCYGRGLRPKKVYSRMVEDILSGFI